MTLPTIRPTIIIRLTVISAGFFVYFDWMSLEQVGDVQCHSCFTNQKAALFYQSEAMNISPRRLMGSVKRTMCSLGETYFSSHLTGATNSVES